MASRNGWPLELGIYAYDAFFQSDGATVIRPPSTDLSETPTSLPLAADTYYLPRFSADVRTYGLLAAPAALEGFN
jgi:hypothetical protein